MSATSLQLPGGLRRRIAKLAASTGQTPHAFMVDALVREAERSELRLRFAAEAADSEREALGSGKAHALDATEVSAHALRDLECLFEFVAEADPNRALARLSSVRAAFEVPADHPLLGRVAENGRRELVLSRGQHGYIAKHRWLPAEDVVLILAVRQNNCEPFAFGRAERLQPVIPLHSETEGARQ